MHCLVFFWQAKTVVLIFALLSYCEKKIVTCPANFIEFLKKFCNLQSALPKLVQQANISSFSDKSKPSYFNSSMQCLVFFWQAKTVVLIFALLSYCEKKLLLVLQILLNFWKNFVISKVPFLNKFKTQMSRLFLTSQNRRTITRPFIVSSFSDKPKPSFWFSRFSVIARKKLLLVLQILLNFWKNFVISKVPFLN